jgi:hypothetical protein
MEIVKTVLIILVVLVVLYLILTVFFKASTSLTTMQEGDVSQTIDASTLPNNNNTSNYTYSMWFYVQDWNYRFGEEKVLLERKDEDGYSSPGIVLGAVENNIIVSVSCYPQNQTTGTVTDTSIVHKCSITNFPLQSWVNLIISLYGRTLDMYVDGKLVRTCVLPGVAKVNPDADISVTPGGGFSGWTSNFEYWDDATNPQQAYNIYKSGFGGSAIGSLFNKYRIKVSFLEDNQEQSSFEI